MFGFQVRGGKATAYRWGHAEILLSDLKREEGWRRPFGFPLFEGEGACKGETRNAGEVTASGAAPNLVCWRACDNGATGETENPERTPRPQLSAITGLAYQQLSLAGSPANANSLDGSWNFCSGTSSKEFCSQIQCTLEGRVKAQGSVEAQIQKQRPYANIQSQPHSPGAVNAHSILRQDIFFSRRLTPSRRKGGCQSEKADSD